MEFDKDLAARQEARSLCRAARQAQKKLSEFPQEKLDRIVEAVARAFSAASATIFAARRVQPTALGWGEKTMEFPAFRAISDL